jgi:hypothetical protein
LGKECIHGFGSCENISFMDFLFSCTRMHNATNTLILKFLINLVVYRCLTSPATSPCCGPHYPRTRRDFAYRYIAISFEELESRLTNSRYADTRVEPTLLVIPIDGSCPPELRTSLRTCTATFLQLQAIQQLTELHEIPLEKFDHPSFPIELHEMTRRSSAELATLSTNLQLFQQAFQERLIYNLLRRIRRPILFELLPQLSSFFRRTLLHALLAENLQARLSVEVQLCTRTCSSSLNSLFSEPQL